MLVFEWRSQAAEGILGGADNEHGLPFSDIVERFEYDGGLELLYRERQIVVRINVGISDGRITHDS